MHKSNKPYHPEQCQLTLEVSIGGCWFYIRSDSKRFLDNLQKHFLSPAFYGTAAHGPATTCYCATHCEFPWELVVETPGGVHMARRDTSGDAAYVFSEWSPDGCRDIGHARLPKAEETAPDDLSMIVLTGYVRRRILRTMMNLERSGSRRVLHAASLATGTEGILIVGDSRSGKSTLALACLSSGMRYMAEENSIIDMERGLLYPFPMPFRMRRHALWLSPAFANLPGSAITDLTGDFRWLIDPAAISQDCINDQPVRLTHLLGLDGFAGQPQIRAASVERMAERCTVADIFADSNDAMKTLWQWVDLLQGKKLASLVAGTPDDTVMSIQEWLKKS